MLNKTNIIYVFNPILLTDVFVASSTVQTWIYISFSLIRIHFTFGVKELYICTRRTFYIKNKQANPAQIYKVTQK